MEIGEFSKKTGLTIDTLRYYDKIKLLEPERRHNRRYYQDEDLEKAYGIVKLKSLDFSLTEIFTLFELEDRIENFEELNADDQQKIRKLLNIIEGKRNHLHRKEKGIKEMIMSLDRIINKVQYALNKGGVKL